MADPAGHAHAAGRLGTQAGEPMEDVTYFDKSVNSDR
jgi:hypothetical protein